MPSVITNTALESMLQNARKILAESKNPGALLGIFDCKLTGNCQIGCRWHGAGREGAHCTTCKGEVMMGEITLKRS